MSSLAASSVPDLASSVEPGRDAGYECWAEVHLRGSLFLPLCPDTLAAARASLVAYGVVKAQETALDAL